MGRSKGARSLLGKLFAIVVLAAIAYVAAMTIPVVLATFRFSQTMDTEVMHGRANEPTSMVHRRLVARAETLGLDIAPEQIVVSKSGARYEINANYVVPVEFIGGVTFNWRFRPHKAGVRRSTALLRD
jgi:hypothetical protein